MGGGKRGHRNRNTSEGIEVANLDLSQSVWVLFKWAEACLWVAAEVVNSMRALLGKSMLSH